MEARLTKKLQHLPVEAKELEELKQEILQASMRAMNHMLFGLRDEVSSQDLPGVPRRAGKGLRKYLSQAAKACIKIDGDQVSYERGRSQSEAGRAASR